MSPLAAVSAEDIGEFKHEIVPRIGSGYDKKSLPPFLGGVHSTLELVVANFQGVVQHGTLPVFAAPISLIEEGRS
jgi:hypothetical protein